MKTPAIILCVMALALPLSAAPRVEFNSGWFFKIDPAKTGEPQGWTRQLPAETEPVELPHTWNIGHHAEYVGTAWYFKSFSNSKAWDGQHVELHFGATFYKSRVWLNGKLVGEHEGGYSEYYFDISNTLRPVNYLAVEINNEPLIDTIPGADRKAGPDGNIYDWWPYGGIVRGAWLTVEEGTLIRRQFIDSRAAGEQAEISNRIVLENFTRRIQPLQLRVSLFAMGSNTAAASTERNLRIKPGREQVTVALQLPQVKLWGIDNPFLYRSEVSLIGSGGRVLDTLTDNFGVRTIEIRDRKMYLNGERVRFTGLARHAVSPWEGLAETRGTMLHDLDDLKNLQATLTRPVHYQQHPFVYDYADRNGILLIPEIPMWQFDESQMKNPKVIALAQQLLRELIEQNYNHPSIFAWSMENESATDTPGGNEYIRTMYAYSKQLDPGRYVTFADDVIAFADPAVNASRLVDFIMWNEYFGSWDAPESLLPAAIEKIGKGFPDKMVLVTEFGYPGVFASDSVTADKKREQIIRQHLPLFAQEDWIGGALLWCYQDYQSFHNLRPGQNDHFVDHGVVDKNRQRRPSYYVWQEMNAPAHIELNWNYDAKGVPVGFRAVVRRRSEREIPSYPLVNYRVEWRVIEAGKKQLAGGAEPLPPLGPERALEGTWEAAKPSSLRLELTLLRPNGFVALRRQITWQNPQTIGLTPLDIGADSPALPATGPTR